MRHVRLLYDAVELGRRQCAISDAVTIVEHSLLGAARRRCVRRRQSILQHRVVEQMTRLLQSRIVTASGYGGHLRVGLVEYAATKGSEMVRLTS